MEPTQPTKVEAQEDKSAAKPKVDVKLLDQQLEDLDSDEFDSDDDHSGGCSCCAGSVGTVVRE